jgi:hypothetical protein
MKEEVFRYRFRIRGKRSLCRLLEP